MGSENNAAAERRFVLLLLIGGIVLRLLLIGLRSDGVTAFYAAGEPTRVALALVREGSFADAYYEGYGPTAHLLPVMPMIAAAVFWLFGAMTVPANLVLLGWALFQTFACYLLVRRLFARLGMDPVAVRWATAMLCLVPVLASQETIDFRFWEAAAAVALAALNLLLLLRFDDKGTLSVRAMLGAAALAAFTFFVSPPTGLAIYLCWGLFTLTRWGWAKAFALTGICAAALALLLAPWVLRNQAAIGSPVLLRSNFGLELALGNHDAAVSGLNPAGVYADRLIAIHPYHSKPARKTLRALGGEVAYSQMLGAQTRAWIAAHPVDFARLTLRHLGQFFFPRPWQINFIGWQELPTPRAAFLSLVSLLGLIGLAAGIAQRRRGYWLIGVYVAVVALPYSVVQPVLRYTYLVYPFLAFLAVEALVRAGRYAVGRFGPGTAR